MIIYKIGKYAITLIDAQKTSSYYFNWGEKLLPENNKQNQRITTAIFNTQSTIKTAHFLLQSTSCNTFLQEFLQ